jgi:hypothetical protein
LSIVQGRDGLRTRIEDIGGKPLDSCGSVYFTQFENLVMMGRMIFWMNWPIGRCKSAGSIWVATLYARPSIGDGHCEF